MDTLTHFANGYAMCELICFRAAYTYWETNYLRSWKGLNNEYTVIRRRSTFSQAMLSQYSMLQYSAHVPHTTSHTLDSRRHTEILILHTFRVVSAPVERSRPVPGHISQSLTKCDPGLHRKIDLRLQNFNEQAWADPWITRLKQTTQHGCLPRKDKARAARNVTWP